MNDKKKPFMVDDSEAEQLYSNVASVNVNGEEACLGLGVRDVRDPGKVNVHTYVYMSLPHFMRFAETVNKNINLLIEKGVITRETEQ